MADPRLNSIHLDGTRRQDFRRAREALLAARGWQTLAAENQAAILDRPDTIDQENGLPPPADPTNVHYWLRDRDSVYPLKVGLNTIGRAPDNDVVLQDCYVSRRHCAVLVHASRGCEVHDTASKNGTYLNGRRIGGPSRLSAGDEIRMCDRQLVFFSRDETPARPEETPDSPTMIE
jgi:pSer/pThr/pTyr-binding forkhead associated (FHA) protein